VDIAVIKERGDEATYVNTQFVQLCIELKEKREGMCSNGWE